MAGQKVRRDEGRERFWRREVDTQRGSGQSVRAYCRGQGLQETTFYHWRRELARRGPAAFVPVTVAGGTGAASRVGEPAANDTQGGRIEILLGNGRRIQVTGAVDRRALGDVLAVVEGRPC